MTININEPSSWGSLPSDLQTLLSDVQIGVFRYPERDRSWQWVQEYLENGNFDMAKSELQKIQTRQNNLRQGLTPELQQLIQAVHADVFDYPERDRSWQWVQEYLENGNFDMAKSELQKIQTRQNNQRQGLTPELQQLIQAVHAGAFNYPERGRSWQWMQEYLGNGNFDMAKSELQKIQTRQNNLQQGLTPELQQLIQAVHADVFDYPERDRSWQWVQEYLENGNFDMAKSELQKIQTRQNNLRQGVTPELQQLIQAVHAGALNYPERDRSWQWVQEYLENGNFSMARSELEKILVRQDNLRQ